MRVTAEKMDEIDLADAVFMRQSYGDERKLLLKRARLLEALAINSAAQAAVLTARAAQSDRTRQLRKGIS